MLSCLVLCTGNSARSQMAEALMNLKGAGRLSVESAGTRPAAQVNPFAIRALAEIGIDWGGRTPRGMDGLDATEWDIVITVCDNARESCPMLPGAPTVVHWGMPDPAGVGGSDEARLNAFRVAREIIQRRVDRMMAIGLEDLDRHALKAALNAIGQDIQ